MYYVLYCRPIMRSLVNRIASYDGIRQVGNAIRVHPICAGKYNDNTYSRRISRSIRGVTTKILPLNLQLLPFTVFCNILLQGKINPNYVECLNYRHGHSGVQENCIGKKFPMTSLSLVGASLTIYLFQLRLAPKYVLYCIT